MSGHRNAERRRHVSEPFWETPTFRVLHANWKLGIHLTLHTKYFGVNNRWWSNLGKPSLLGWPTRRIILGILTAWPILVNVRNALIRAYGCGAMAPEERIHMEPVVKYLGKFINLKMLDMYLKFTREYYELLPKERRIYD